nr:hypothetical protein [Phenylobacterium sp.]
MQLHSGAALVLVWAIAAGAVAYLAPAFTSLPAHRRDPEGTVAGGPRSCVP